MWQSKEIIYEQIKHALKSDNNTKWECQTEKCTCIMTPLTNAIKMQLMYNDRN